jgi:hypothetical protein
MAYNRGRLRIWAVAWLVFQAASLSALVPRECCRADQHAASSPKPGCHEQAPAVHHCDMPSAKGARCPMHAIAESGPGEDAGVGCSLRGTCDGPAATFLALLANHGVLTDPFAVSPDLPRSLVPLDAREILIGRLASPDSPPPRA